MKPILGSKLAKSDYSLLFVALTFRNRLQYRHSDFQKFICDDLAALYATLGNFGQVAPEFNIAKRVQPLVSFCKTNISGELSQELPDRFSPNFHRMVDI